jgi:hypothetical protein
MEGVKIPILKPNFQNLRPSKKRKLADVPGLQLAGQKDETQNNKRFK